MTSYNRVGIAIPAFNPDNKLISLVEELIAEGFNNVVILDDGSNSECADIFLKLKSLTGCKVIHHEINKGKGKALKTAFSYFLDNHTDIIGIVTVDADGQHTVKDIKNVTTELKRDPNSLILGARNFSEENIPFRSKFGNVLTKSVFRFTSGIKISDTQTGLRGVPLNFSKHLLDVKGDGYEFEMKMLIECKTHNVNIEEVEIETIYIDGNDSSHFNPILDSLKIYSVFLKFGASSVVSFLADILLFSLFVFMLKENFNSGFIIYATVGARILSSIFNYALNRNIVFKSNSKNTLIKYYTLSLLLMITSALIVNSIYLMLGTGEVVIKAGIDTILFLLSYIVQREWVFKSKP